MQISDLIAVAALLAALLSAWYARDSRDANRRANDISVHQTLRPLRLAAYQIMRQFSDYCVTYRTLQHVDAVRGTHNLVEQIENFKWEIAQLGYLGMPVVEEKSTQFVNKAWQMQRVLDRIAGGQNIDLDSARSSDEQNLDHLVDWFDAEHRQLSMLFLPYLDGRGNIG